MKTIIALLTTCALLPSPSYAEDIYYDAKRQYIDEINYMATSICESYFAGKILSTMKYDGSSSPMCYSYTMRNSFYHRNSFLTEIIKYDSLPQHVIERLKKESQGCYEYYIAHFIIFNPINYKIFSTGCTANFSRNL